MFKYIKEVEVLPKFRDALRVKQGGSKERARKKWLEAKERVASTLGEISDRDRLLVLAAIYWGEGSKGEFNLINGDPYLIRSFLKGLYTLGVPKSEIRLGLRIFAGMDIQKTIFFWTNFLNIDQKQLVGYEILKGGDNKRLIYGMCRVRIVRAAAYFKSVISMIDYIKLESTPP